MEYKWSNTGNFTRKSYTCGHCGHKVGPDKGYSCSVERAGGEKEVGRAAYIYICPHCTRPTFFDADQTQIPGVRIGSEVVGVTDKNVEALYDEVIYCAAAGAYTAAVLVSRKILMNLAVHKGASEGKSFLEYVE
jgi:hypothetical protein